MARWTRAARALSLPPGSKVLDLGCAFGFGTRFLTPRFRGFGHDLSGEYIARARRSVPSATFTVGPADNVPYPDAFFDGVLLLDVLEHVPDEQLVLDEVGRVLRPGGLLIISIPNHGLLAGWDSLNVYQRLLGGRASPPTDDPSWHLSPVHRHYAARDVAALIAPWFRVRSVSFSGLGVAEPLNLVLLLLCKALLRQKRAYDLLQYLYFAAYLIEDVLPAGAWGYHLQLIAERI